MFESDSRYAKLTTGTLRLPDGRQVRYVRRRLVPRAGTHRTIGVVSPIPGERLDNFTVRTLGNPEQFWRLCDANGVIDPFDAIEPGRSLDIPLPE